MSTTNRIATNHKLAKFAGGWAKRVFGKSLFRQRYIYPKGTRPWWYV